MYCIVVFLNSQSEYYFYFIDEKLGFRRVNNAHKVEAPIHRRCKPMPDLTLTCRSSLHSTHSHTHQGRIPPSSHHPERGIPCLGNNGYYAVLSKEL